MNPLLEQFILESRDFLQGIGEHLIELENQPDDSERITELFRLVHTLKGNSGLFDLPSMTRVLHAGEDLMDAVRSQQMPYSQALADALLDAMDFVSLLLDELESNGGQLSSQHSQTAQKLADALRTALSVPLPLAAEEVVPNAPLSEATSEAPIEPNSSEIVLPLLPEAIAQQAWRLAHEGKPLFLIGYQPEEECFFKGEDPFYQARQTPGLLWGHVQRRGYWECAEHFDYYRCQLDFIVLSSAEREELDEHFRYVPEQVSIQSVSPLALIQPQGDSNGGPVYGDFVAEALNDLERLDLAALTHSARTLLELSSPDLWLASVLRWLLLVLETSPEQRVLLKHLILTLNTTTAPDFTQLPQQAPVAAEAVSERSSSKPTPSIATDTTALWASLRQAVLDTQLQVLALPDTVPWLAGRIQGVAASLKACLELESAEQAALAVACQQAQEEQQAAPLRQWLLNQLQKNMPLSPELGSKVLTSDDSNSAAECIKDVELPATTASVQHEQAVSNTSYEAADNDSRPNPRRPEESGANSNKVLKVDQGRIDRLMNLIGEMVVAKNALPYLASRAETQYGIRELSREIKAQYAVINRIAEDMQDAIMHIRMMPVSFVFQRFPRLIRDISRRLGKEVHLQLEGQETEADKNIVEALADPLIHLVRNSLDHGLESPDARCAAGKPAVGQLIIRAHQESDRVLIEISDDGRGIDPSVIKRKAYEKGLLDEVQLERISDQEAINLVFAPGFSTAEAVSDLSGRGVGMDAVRNAIEKIGGTVVLQSQTGKGTQVRLSLPLSMSVTNVMVIESDQQIFGIPMELVVETVRLPQDRIQVIKQQQATVLRGRIIPLVSLNSLLEIAAPPQVSEDNELAALVVRVGTEHIGLLVDDFREVVDVILKPLPGELSQLNCYAGTALLGDGSVLMVLNPKELF